MTLLKVRRHGNSLAVTLTPEVLQQAKLREGDLVEEKVDGRGRVVLEPVTVRPRVSPAMAAAIKSAAKKERRVLERLATHDRQ